jgi:hypothetical protein
MVTDTILERTSAAGVTIDGVLLKDGGITATGTNTINLTTITANTINETTSGSGVSVDGVLLKDGNVSTPASGTVTTTNIAAKDTQGLIFKNATDTSVVTITDAGAVTLGAASLSAAHQANGSLKITKTGEINLQVNGDIVTKSYLNWNFPSAYLTRMTSNTASAKMLCFPLGGDVTDTTTANAYWMFWLDHSSTIDASDTSGSSTNLRLEGPGKFICPAIYAATNATAANVYIDSSGIMYRSTSAAKYKTNVRELDVGIETVNKMKPVRFNSLCENDDKSKDFIGFIADDEEVNTPELVVKNNEGEVEGFSYDRLTAVLVKAIQELSAKVDSLQAELNTLKGQ